MGADGGPAGQQHGRRDSQGQAQRNHNGRGRRLRGGDVAHQVTGNDKDPGVLVGKAGDHLGQVAGLGADKDVDHPAQADDNDGGEHAGLEDLRLQNGVGLLLPHQQGDHCGRHQHEDLNDVGHAEGLVVAEDGAEGGNGAEDDHADHGAEEHENGDLADLAELAEVDLLFLMLLFELEGAVRDAALELGIVGQLLALLEHDDAGGDGAQQGGGDHDQQDLDHADAGALHEADQSGHGGGQRRGADRVLGGNDGSCDGTLGTDAVFNGQLVDDGQDAPYDVAGAAAENEDPGDDGGQDGHGLGMLAEDLFGDGDQVIDAADGLHGAAGQHNAEDDAQNGKRRIRHLSAEDKGEDEHADAACQGEENAAFPDAPEDQGEQNEKLDPEHFFFSFQLLTGSFGPVSRIV